MSGERPTGADGPGFETRAIHAGQPPDPTTGAVVPPVSLSTTFAQEAVAILREYGVSQVPVVKAEPPLALAEVVGTVTEHDLLTQLVSTPASFDARVADVMTPPLPMVGTGEAIEVASARLADHSAVLVVDGGHPTGIITRSDLLDFLSGAGR